MSGYHQRPSAETAGLAEGRPGPANLGPWP
jgi:hypothetical protein